MGCIVFLYLQKLKFYNKKIFFIKNKYYLCIMNKQIIELSDNWLLIVYDDTYKFWIHKDHLETYEEGIIKWGEEMDKLEYKYLFGDNDRTK